MPRPVPPPLHTGEIGSFAHDTLARRVPAILQDARRRLAPLPADVEAACHELGDELANGPLRGLREAAADRPDWDAAVAPHLGRSWLDIPWYFAEAFFYRRLLEATGYFADGALRGRDPFASNKAEEWAPREAPQRLADMLETLPHERAPRLRALLLASLWGNRSDLSYNVAAALGAHSGDAADLLVDDTDAIRAHLERGAARVVIIADNTGTELAMDLALIAHLIDDWRIPLVDLHVKAHPFFVSDTMIADVDEAVAALGAGAAASAALAERIRALRVSGHLIVRAFPFYTSSLFYTQLPDDLRAELGGCDLALVKGDANYRRLCSDARWPPETPFAEVVADFPAPVVALRTLKAEVVVGLPPGKAAALAAEDPRWMVNGRRGVIQARLR